MSERIPGRRRPGVLVASLALGLALCAPARGGAQAVRARSIPAARVCSAWAGHARSIPAARMCSAWAGHARSARSVTVNDTAHLHLLKAFGSVLQEEGHAAGTLPGQTKVRMVIGSSVSASFSIRAAAGTIFGKGGASLHSSGRYASFGGWLSVSHGSGRYAHAHGSGKLYGVIDRRTDALTVQTLGTLRY